MAISINGNRDFWVITNGRGGIISRDDGSTGKQHKQTPWLFASEAGAKRFVTELHEEIVKVRLEVVQ